MMRIDTNVVLVMRILHTAFEVTRNPITKKPAQEGRLDFHTAEDSVSEEREVGKGENWKGEGVRGEGGRG
jgi:hypothetical protein